MSPVKPAVDDGMDPERHVRREARERQAWADHARRVAEDRRRHRRFLWLMWTAILAAACIALATIAVKNANAHHGKGCHTVKCFDRTARWQSATASVYDGIGLGGRVACLGRWPGGYVLAHKTLACGTRVRVCYQQRCVTARVWDRGPFVAGRDFDLDVAVQRATGFPYGVATIRYRIRGNR